MEMVVGILLVDNFSMLSGMFLYVGENQQSIRIAFILGLGKRIGM